MTAALLALAAALSPAGAGAFESCLKAYAPEHESQWGLSQAQWERRCASGAKPADILREHQAAEMQACSAHFAAGLRKAALPDWNLQVYCAQGPGGEARLSVMTGTAARRAPKPAEPSEKNPPAGSSTSDPPAKQVYALVMSKGSLYRQDKLGPPDGVQEAPRIMFYSEPRFDVFVPLDHPRPVCFAKIGPSVGGLSCYPYRVEDPGCTGRASAMRQLEEKAKRCTPAQLDEAFRRVAGLIAERN